MATRKSTNTALHVAPATDAEQLDILESVHEQAGSTVHALAYFMGYVARNGTVIEPLHFGVAAELIEEEIRRAMDAFSRLADLARANGSAQPDGETL